MKNLFYILIIFSLSSCSIGGSYYIRNFLDQPATITILIHGELNSDQWKNRTFDYVEELVKIKHSSYKRFDKKIYVQVVDDGRIQLLIPPKSTVMIGFGSNMRIFEFQKAIIKYDNVEESINLDDNEQLNIKMRGLMKYTGHYDINEIITHE